MMTKEQYLTEVKETELEIEVIKPQLSIVLPIYNEEESLPHLLAELVPALEATGRTFEIICIDDGSKDASFNELKKIGRAHV